MPHFITGDKDLVFTGATATVLSCAAGLFGQVLVTTTASNPFATFDYVTITGVVGTTEANGTFKITVTNSNQFLLNGVVFVNPYVSGGVIVDHALSPAFQMPDDGEAATVSSIGVAVEALANRTQFLNARISDLPVIVPIVTATGINDGVFGTCLEVAVGPQNFYFFNINTAASGLLPGDVVLFTLNAYIGWKGGGSFQPVQTNAYVQAYVETQSSTIVPMPGTKAVPQIFQGAVLGGPATIPVDKYSCAGQYTVTEAGSIHFGLLCFLDSSYSINLFAPTYASIYAYRP